jgi:DNA-binding PadR family transcriptional regulator
MSDLKLTLSLLAMLERIERNSGSLLMLAVTASGGGEYGKLNKLRGAGYIVKCDHPSVTEGAWPVEALAITEAGRAALANRRAELAKKKRRHQRVLKSNDEKKVVFRRDGERYIVFLDDDRLGFVRLSDNGTWNFVDSTMAHSGYTKTRQRAGQLLRRRFEQMVRQGEI